MKSLKSLKSFDLFGYPISLTFQKKTQFTTILGGCITLIIKIFFFLLSLYSFYKLFSQEYEETSNFQNNLGEKYGDLKMDSSNFMLTLRFDQDLINNWANPFLNVNVVKVFQSRNGTKVSKKKVFLNMSNCEINMFPGLEKSFSQLNLEKALCPQNLGDFSLVGNFQEDEFSYLQVSVSNCLGKDNCQKNETFYENINSFGKLN